MDAWNGQRIVKRLHVWIRLGWLCLLVLLLSSCQTPPAPTPTLPEAILPSPTSPLQTTMVVTMAVLPTETTAQTLTPPGTEISYPAGPTPTMGAAESLQAVGVAYQDCARTPGLLNCGAQAAAISGRLAFWDMTAARLISLDLATGQGWQASFAGLSQTSSPLALIWSPNAEKLLAAAGQEARIYDSTGHPIQTMGLHADGEIPAWNADGTLDQPTSVHAVDGTTASLEITAQDQLLLHIQPRDASEKSLPLDVQPTGEQYRLLSWVPGQQTLLAQRFYASNAAMLQGGELLLLDAKTGALQPLDANVGLGQAAALAWDPSQTGRLAFLETAANGVMAPRLGILDLPAAVIRYPLPENTIVSGFAWQPGVSAGQARLALAVGGASGVGSYLAILDPQSGALSPLTQPPAGALDGWPHWGADGKTVVYARSISPSGGGPFLEVRGHLAEDGADWLLVAGLPAPQIDGPTNPWDVLLAFGAPAHP